MLHARSLVVVFSLLSITLSSSAHSAEPILLHLKGGRSLTGLVDAKSSDTALWLRQERGASYLRRRIEWWHVASAEQAGIALDRDEVLGLATPAVSAPRTAAAPVVTPVSEEPNALPPTSLDFSLELANWNADAALDGLVLSLRPLNSQGEVVPVAGQVVVECWGLQRGNGKPMGEMTPVERWSRPVTAMDFDAFRGARLQLPYGAINPIQAVDFQPWGLVRVRLSIPGQGTLEGLADGVRIKPMTPVQDAQRISELFPR